MDSGDWRPLNLPIEILPSTIQSFTPPLTQWCKVLLLFKKWISKGKWFFKFFGRDFPKLFMKPGSYRVAVVVDSWYKDSPQQCWLISWWVCWRRWGKCSRRHKIETFESFEPSPWTWSALHVTRIPGDSLTDDWQGAGLCNGFHSRNQPTLLALGISLSMMVTMVMMIRATNRTRCHTHYEAIFQCRDLAIDSSHPVVIDFIQISKT